MENGESDRNAQKWDELSCDMNIVEYILACRQIRFMVAHAVERYQNQLDCVNVLCVCDEENNVQFHYVM